MSPRSILPVGPYNTVVFVIIISLTSLSVCCVFFCLVPKFGFHGDVTTGPVASFVPASKGL